MAAKTTITEGLVKVRCGMDWVQTAGTWDDDCPHLAVTEAVGDSRRLASGEVRWVVSHLPSGKAINRPGTGNLLLMNRDAAVALRELLIPAAKWSRKKLPEREMAAAREIVNSFLARAPA